MPALRSALRDITPADIQRLVDDAWTEDETLEFKRTLATPDGRPHPWLTGDAELRGARGDLLAEVVAMANSYGGDVILGVDEAEEAPPRASAIVPIPRCVDLAHRIEMTARDLVKPQIPLLGVRGIPIEGDAGVVVIRAPRSRMAPHRLEIKGSEKECYRRVSDRTESMTMREIQELTLSTTRGLDRIEASLTALAHEFQTWFANQKRPEMVSFGFCVRAVPLTAEPYLRRVHGNQDARPVDQTVRATVAGNEFDLHTIRNATNWRPILRGTEARHETPNRESRLMRLCCEGSFVDMSRISTPSRRDAGDGLDRHHLYAGWFLGTVFCALRTVDRYRRAAGAESIDYALQAEIVTEQPLPVIKLGGRGVFDASGTIDRAGMCFPTYEVGDQVTWDDLANLMWNDFWNAIGVVAEDGELRVQWPA